MARRGGCPLPEIRRKRSVSASEPPPPTRRRGSAAPRGRASARRLERREILEGGGGAERLLLVDDVLHRDLLLRAGGLITRRDVEDPVGVETERDVDLRLHARRLGDAG